MGMKDQWVTNSNAALLIPDTVGGNGWVMTCNLSVQIR